MVNNCSQVFCLVNSSDRFPCSEFHSRFAVHRDDIDFFCSASCCFWMTQPLYFFNASSDNFAVSGPNQRVISSKLQSKGLFHYICRIGSGLHVVKGYRHCNIKKVWAEEASLSNSALLTSSFRFTIFVCYAGFRVRVQCLQCVYYFIWYVHSLYSFS